MSDYFETDEVVKEYDSRITGRIISYIKPYKALAVLSLAALGVSTLGELFIPVFIRRVIDTVIFVKDRAPDFSLLHRSCVILFLALLGTLVFSFVHVWSISLIAQRVMRDIRLALFETTLGQSSAALSRHPVGRIVTRLTGDVETINEFFTQVIGSFLKDFAVMVGVLIALFFLSPKLALVTLVTVPPVAAVAVWSRVKARDAFRRQRSASSLVNSYLSERLGGVQVVQLFCREQQSATEFGTRNGELLDANLGEMYVYATFRPVIDLLCNVTIALVIAWGANLALSASLSPGVLIAFISLITMFFTPVQDIAEKYTTLQSAMAGGERVFKFLDADERIPDAGEASLSTSDSPILKRALPVVFQDVRFAYKPGEDILRGLSFTVKPGEMIALVGYTGAGKTTIINLLTRLWDVSSGRILLGGRDIRDVPLASLHRGILPVLQDVFLFSGTVRDNICLGLPLSDDEVERACRTVYAHGFISRLPQGYGTVLAESASNISSGQRQLLSFARVIAHDPAIVVLDEATSSIDTETEGLIQLAMKQALAGRTSIVIAHRLSTIKDAARILVLSGGVVVEEGTHDELVARNGVYAKLYRLQYSEE
ncbi:MAG: ABC transporter ATP-binding protein/permease [Spirochaetaceae bacterium]|jgi:ATP-binding cassette subfamily B protein|nr:ABC transporter ATP-binding protein/permease [Spirochaetaceae bacterium]